MWSGIIFLNILLVYAMHDREDFYVEMRLGVHAKKFNFHVDTGSKQSWVYCKIRGHRSKLTNLVRPSLFHEFEAFGSMPVTMHVVKETVDLKKNSAED